ncbi:MAG: efflux RND transporter periplasmic adaptor subunit [Rubellimicrobium sp.]|nr:efflux RND transporter periplasmic adaptor subunit [Rubellimicrobium sp.]
MTLHPKAAALVALLLAATPAPADVPLAVRVVRAEPAPVAEGYELTGTVEARSPVPLAFRGGGRVTEVLVQVGDSVPAGAVVARVDDTQARAAVDAGEAQLAATEAGLTQARLAHERAADLLARGAGTRADLDRAEEALLAAASAHDQAAAQVEKAHQAEADTEITAPVAGIITERSAEPGQIAGPAQPVLTLAPDGEREVVFHGPGVAQVDGLLGRVIRVSLLDAPEVFMAATISEISPLADARTGTVLVRARLGADGAGAALGEPVVASVTLDETVTVSLPAAALATVDGRPAVWVVDPDSHAVALRMIEVGAYTSDMIEVASGLPDGALVVTDGAHLLYPGRIVRPVDGEE